MTSLQFIWFLLIGVLFAGYAVLDGFDLGVGFWHLFSKDERERRAHIQAIGPHWDGNEVWLITAGGALFAAFPPVYATIFSGFYLAMMLVLLALIFRALSIEFRYLIDGSPRWSRFWDFAFGIGSTAAAILFGVALGNVVAGIELSPEGEYIGGFFALLDPYSLIVGVTGLAMFAYHGALFKAVRTDGELRERARRHARITLPIYLALFLITTIWSLTVYTHGAFFISLLGVLIAVSAIVLSGWWLKAGKDWRAFLGSAAAILALFGALGASVFPYIVPGVEPGTGLKIAEASSSQYTLGVMLIVAIIGVPLVLGYTIYIYRHFSGVITGEEDSGY